MVYKRWSNHVENLSFSTNVNRMKCKTKCMAFLKRERTLKNITLDGKDLRQNILDAKSVIKFVVSKMT